MTDRENGLEQLIAAQPFKHGDVVLYQGRSHVVDYLRRYKGDDQCWKNRAKDRLTIVSVGGSVMPPSEVSFVDPAKRLRGLAALAARYRQPQP